MKAIMTMRDALEHREIFGSILPGESWASWRVLLIAMMGEPLRDDERPIFESLTGRPSEPLQRVDEFWAIVGRRGGKTRAIAVLSAYIASLVDWHDVLAPGEKASLPVLSHTTLQAQKAMEYLDGIFSGVPALKKLVIGQTSDTITLSTRVVIEVRPASFRSIRGGTFCAAICDEVAFWRSEATANADTEILNAVRPSLATTGGLLACISSPYARRGEVYGTWKREFGANGDPLIVVAKAASRTMNPSLPEKFVKRAYARDAAVASAEFGGEFRTDVEAFVSREAVEACIAAGAFERAPLADCTYHGFVDPSGGSVDSMTLAIAHREGEIIVLDCLREVKPPFSPEAVVKDFAELLKSYRVGRVRGDRYAGEWPAERFQVNGISYEAAAKPKSDIYRDLLPILNAGRVALLDNVKLVTQLVSLERRTARGGKDSIDHPPGGHDDVVNAAAGVLVGLDLDRRPALVRQSDVLENGAALPLPTNCKHIVSVMVADNRGMTATVYAAITYSGPRLLILDYDVAPLHGGLFSDIAARVRELAVQCRARGASAFAPAGLASHAQAAGLFIQGIPEHLVPEDLLVPAASHIAAGSVKICTPAQEKAKSSPFGAALDFRASEKADDPLRQAAVLLIALSLIKSNGG